MESSRSLKERDMLGIEAGIVVGYEAGEGRATIRTRSPLRRGDSIRIIGSTTDLDLRLKAPRWGGSSFGEADDGDQLFDVLRPPVEIGDIVFRHVGK